MPKLRAQPNGIWGRVTIGLGKGYRCQGQIFTPERYIVIFYAGAQDWAEALDMSFPK